jgi:hypothetical protein
METFKAEHPDPTPPPAGEGQPAAQENAEAPKSPEDLSSAGSPEPALIPPPAVAPGAGKRIMVPPPLKPQDSRRGMRAPYNPVDANQRAIRFLKKQAPVWTPDTNRRDTDPEPRPQPRLLNPTGAPILE